MMNLDALIRAFLSYAKVEKGLSANTIEAYSRDLERFSVFAHKRNLQIDTITRDDVVDFLSSLYRNQLDSRSVGRYLVSIRNLFRFALTEGLITADPSLNLESPKMRKSLPSYLRVEDVDRLLAQPDV